MIWLQTQSSVLVDHQYELWRWLGTGHHQNVGFELRPWLWLGSSRRWVGAWVPTVVWETLGWSVGPDGGLGWGASSWHQHDELLQHLKENTTRKPCRIIVYFAYMLSLHVMNSIYRTKAIQPNIDGTSLRATIWWATEPNRQTSRSYTTRKQQISDHDIIDIETENNILKQWHTYRLERQ